MQFSLRTKIILMGLLIGLNIILRYTMYPHEIGWDSFGVHTMANSISEFGYAKWWLHPTSIYGAYPYSSSPSAVPFVLSGMSQGTSMDMEKVILLYSMILVIFSIFSGYVMAGVIWDNDIFKFLVALVFSTSQGIVTYSTWTANARTLFVILLPLFIYLLLKARTFKVRCGILTVIILALFLVTHHYIYFTIPIVISFLIVSIIYTLGKHIKTIKIPENVANFAIIAGFLVMFSIPFFTGTLAEVNPGGMAGGRYAWLFYMTESYTRYIGIFIVFVVSGYIYLTFKCNKRFEEWFLLLCLAALAQFLYIITYMKWFIIPFVSLFIGIALTNVAIIKTHRQKRKIIASLIVVVLLLFSVCFTGYYQYLHFLNDQNPNKRWMEERTYVGALWMKDTIDKDKKVIAETYVSGRLFAISEVPTLTGIGAADLAYGFVDPNKLEVKQIHSYTSAEYYMQDPYKVVNHSYTDWQVSHILNSDINDRMSWAYRLTSWSNLSYYAENKDTGGKLSQSVQQTKDCLYDNGKICIWELDNTR
jgi:hypothetical protein